MAHLDIEKLRTTPLQHEPYEYLIVPGFLKPEALDAAVSDYPDISSGGSYPLDTLAVSAPLQAVIDELDGPEFEAAIAEKFDIDLADRPKMYSLRGRCRATDGKIHTDSKDKIITVLLYMNKDWSPEGGRLRVLRSGTDLEDYAAEVPPDQGTLLVFKRSDSSWHGHGPFDGIRRSIQMNWMTTEGRRGFHRLRHKISARLKKLAVAS